MEGRTLFGPVLGLGMALLVTGCAAVAPLSSLLTGAGPAASTEVHTQTDVKLQEGNFVLIRTNAVGISKGFKLLGFITLRPATLTQAMDQLYADAQAQHGRPQTLVHLVVEHSGIYVILFSIPQVSVRADLIEFLPVGEEEQPEDEITPKGLGVQRVSAKAGIHRQRPQNSRVQ